MLIAALEQRPLHGAVPKLLWSEPAVDLRLAALPHTGSATVERCAAMGELQRRNWSAVLGGQATVTPRALLARDAAWMLAHSNAHFDALTRSVATRFHAESRTGDMEEGP